MKINFSFSCLFATADDASIRNIEFELQWNLLLNEINTILN